MLPSLAATFTQRVLYAYSLSLFRNCAERLKTGRSAFFLLTTGMPRPIQPLFYAFALFTLMALQNTAFSQGGAPAFVDVAYDPSLDDLFVNGNTAESDNQPSLYPNPTTGRVTLTGLETGAGYTYEVHDLQGRSLATGTVGIRSEINLAHLPAGVYAVQVTAQDGQPVLRTKLVVVR